MGWLRKRFGEPSTMVGLGVIFSIAAPLIPPQYQLLVQGLAAALGLGGVVLPESGNNSGVQK